MAPVVSVVMASVPPTVMFWPAPTPVPLPMVMFLARRRGGEGYVASHVRRAKGEVLRVAEGRAGARELHHPATPLFSVRTMLPVPALKRFVPEVLPVVMVVPAVWVILPPVARPSIRFTLTTLKFKLPAVALNVALPLPPVRTSAPSAMDAARSDVVLPARIPAEIALPWPRPALRATSPGPPKWTRACRSS